MSGREALTAQRDVTVGRRLRDLRKAAGMSLRKAAWATELHYSTISKVENGQEYATDRVVRLLCAAYDAEADLVLLERDIERVPLMVRRAIEAAAAREALPSVEEMTAALVRVGGLHTLSWVEYAEAVLTALRAARASDGGR